MIHPIKTNGSCPPTTHPQGPRGFQQARMMNAENTRLTRTELYASAATGARTPPLGCCSSTISWLQRESIPHMCATLLLLSKPFPDQLCAVRAPLTFHPAAPLHCQVAARMDEISSADVNTDISSRERERKINKE